MFTTYTGRNYTYVEGSSSQIIPSERLYSFFDSLNGFYNPLARKTTLFSSAAVTSLQTLAKASDPLLFALMHSLAVRHPRLMTNGVDSLNEDDPQLLEVIKRGMLELYRAALIYYSSRNDRNNLALSRIAHSLPDLWPEAAMRLSTIVYQRNGQPLAREEKLQILIDEAERGVLSPIQSLTLIETCYYYLVTMFSFTPVGGEEFLVEQILQRL